MCVCTNQWELFCNTNYQGCKHADGNSMDTRGIEGGITGDYKNCFEKRWITKNDNLMKFEEDNLKFE